MKQRFVNLLVSVLIAFGLWFYVVTVVSPESENTFYNIPVVLNNEAVLSDRGLMVTTEDAPKVTLRLRGNRNDLNNLKTSDIAVVADLSKINEDGQQELSYSVSFTGSGGNNAFEIVSQSPGKITLEVTEWDTKEVAVNVAYEGTLGLDYIAYMDEAVLDYETVTITGPKAVVDQISQAVVGVDLDDHTETFSQSFRYTLCDENGQPVDAADIKTNVAEVNLTLRIQRVKEVQLLLDVVYGGGTTAQNTVFTSGGEELEPHDSTITLGSIKVTGSEKMLEDLDSITVGSINLADCAEDTTLVFPVTLQEGVENLTGVSEVSVDVAFRNLKTKVLHVTKFLVSGKPSDMNYEVGAKTMAVTVRGPEALIDAITEENVSLLISLAGAQLGENLYKAQVMIDTQYENGGVGAIGSYSVLVTLSERAGGTE